MMLKTNSIPKPSHVSSCQFLSPPGGAPSSAVHWRQLRHLHPLLAIWAVAAVGPQLTGPGWPAQVDLHLSAGVKSYWQPAIFRQQVSRLEILGDLCRGKKGDTTQV